MSGFVRKATLFTAAGLLAATASMAQVIKIVGHAGGVLDPAGAVTYTLPAPGVLVTLDFSACGDVRICSSQVGNGLATNCAAKSVSGVTNAANSVTFVVAGASSAGPPSLTKCVRVRADGVPIDILNAATADYDGVGGVTLLDVSTCYGEVGTNRLRSDFDGNSVVSLLDVSVLYGIVVGGASPLSCTALCP